MNMKKYILIGLMFVFGLSLTTEAQNLPAKKREAIEQTMYNMNYTKALQDVNTELQTYPEDYDLNLFKAICCSAIEEHSQEAVAAYQVAIDKAKTDCERNEARYYLAKHYCQMGQKAKSLEVANSILNGDGQLDDCALEMLDKLSKSACMSNCDQAEIEKIKKEAAEKDAANNKKISDLDKSLQDSKANADKLKEAMKLKYDVRTDITNSNTKSALDAYADMISKCSDYSITLNGKADPNTKASNVEPQSKARALAAKDYLVSKGVDPSRITTTWEQGKDVADPTKEISADGYYKLHFLFNKTELDGKSKEILDRFTTFLKNNPTVKAKCIGHADMVGSNEANNIISRARAMKAKDYLISKGIAAERIVTSYKGEDEPEVIDQYLVKDYPQFKVGEELTDAFINKLPKAKKAEANHLNRRVELEIIK